MDVSSAVLKPQTVPPMPAVSELVAAGRTVPPDGQPLNACTLPSGIFQYDGASNERPPG